MSFPTSTKPDQKGSALVVAIIVLTLLTVIGFAALEVADLNINIAANDRDAKEAFFHADAGVNIGHVFLNESLYTRNASFYEKQESIEFYTDGVMRTLVWANETGWDSIEGESLQSGAGYDEDSRLRIKLEYVIMAERTGARNSVASVQMGWKYIH